MRIHIVINDETIKADIREEIEEMESLCEITFNSEGEREEFVDECFDEIASRCECYADYFPSYDKIWESVHILAECRE